MIAPRSSCVRALDAVTATRGPLDAPQAPVDGEQSRRYVFLSTERYARALVPASRPLICSSDFCEFASIELKFASRLISDTRCPSRCSICVCWSRRDSCVPRNRGAPAPAASSPSRCGAPCVTRADPMLRTVTVVAPDCMLTCTRVGEDRWEVDGTGDRDTADRVKRLSAVMRERWGSGVVDDLFWYTLMVQPGELTERARGPRVARALRLCPRRHEPDDSQRAARLRGDRATNALVSACRLAKKRSFEREHKHLAGFGHEVPAYGRGRARAAQQPSQEVPRAHCAGTRVARTIPAAADAHRKSRYAGGGRRSRRD
jgi:hypothetical protein